MIDKKHIIRLNNKEYVTFPGLLNLAHERGLDSVETVIEQIPRAENQHTAVVRATVTFRPLGEGSPSLSAFTCVGDASPATTKVNAYLRMAETRAIGRCFRMALNIGETMHEELGGDDEPRSAPQGAATDTGNGHGQEAFCSYDGCGLALTPGQAKVSLAKYNAPYCPQHQKVMAEAAR